MKISKRLTHFSVSTHCVRTNQFNLLSTCGRIHVTCVTEWSWGTPGESSTEWGPQGEFSARARLPRYTDCSAGQDNCFANCSTSWMCCLGCISVYSDFTSKWNPNWKKKMSRLSPGGVQMTKKCDHIQRRRKSYRPHWKRQKTKDIGLYVPTWG